MNYVFMNYVFMNYVFMNYVFMNYVFMNYVFMNYVFMNYVVSVVFMSLIKYLKRLLSINDITDITYDDIIYNFDLERKRYQNATFITSKLCVRLENSIQNAEKKRLNFIEYADVLDSKYIRSSNICDNTTRKSNFIYGAIEQENLVKSLSKKHDYYEQLSITYSGVAQYLYVCLKELEDKRSIGSVMNSKRVNCMLKSLDNLKSNNLDLFINGYTLDNLISKELKKQDDILDYVTSLSKHDIKNKFS